MTMQELQAISEAVAHGAEENIGRRRAARFELRCTDCGAIGSTYSAPWIRHDYQNGRVHMTYVRTSYMLAAQGIREVRS